MACLAGNDLGHRHALVLGLVRQHRPGDHVADGIDPSDIGPQMPVGLDAAAIIQLNTRLSQARARRV